MMTPKQYARWAEDAVRSYQNSLAWKLISHGISTTSRNSDFQYGEDELSYWYYRGRWA